MTIAERRSRERPFGRYLLTGSVGKGSITQVHRARLADDSPVELPLCLKVFHPGFSKQLHLVKVLGEKRRSVRELRHDNVARTFEIGKVGESFYVATEHVPGWTLTRVVEACRARGRTLPLGLALYIVREVLMGLEEARQVFDADGRPDPLAHGDLSTGSVRITAAGRVRIIDLAVGRTMALYRLGSGRGSLGHLAPEQFQGFDADHRTDLWAVGALLMELARGRPLFDGLDRHDVAAAVAAFDPGRLSSLLPGHLVGLLPLVGEALVPVREHRAATAGRLLALLDGVAQSTGLRGEAVDLASFVGTLFAGEAEFAEPPPEFAGVPKKAPEKKIETLGQWFADLHGPTGRFALLVGGRLHMDITSGEFESRSELQAPDRIKVSGREWTNPAFLEGFAARLVDGEAVARGTGFSVGTFGTALLRLARETCRVGVVSGSAAATLELSRGKVLAIDDSVRAPNNFARLLEAEGVLRRGQLAAIPDSASSADTLSTVVLAGVLKPGDAKGYWRSYLQLALSRLMSLAGGELIVWPIDTPDPLPIGGEDLAHLMVDGTRKGLTPELLAELYEGEERRVNFGVEGADAILRHLEPTEMATIATFPLPGTPSQIASVGGDLRLLHLGLLSGMLALERGRG